MWAQAAPVPLLTIRGHHPLPPSHQPSYLHLDRKIKGIQHNPKHHPACTSRTNFHVSQLSPRERTAHRGEISGVLLGGKERMVEIPEF